MSPHDPPFSADLAQEDGAIVVRLCGELDIATAPRLRECVEDVLRVYHRAVTIDLATLSFVDVGGLRSLLHVEHAVRALGADFRIRSAGELTRKIIRLVDFPELTDSIDTVSQ